MKKVPVETGAARVARLTCPSCGYQSVETMPLDACLYFHECAACKQVIRPKPGDCCVFCSFADRVCPPKQLERCRCG